MNNNEILLKTEQLCKNYGSKAALKNVDLVLPCGSIIGLLGPNGSGKTTLLKILSGMNTVYQGKAFILGQTPGAETKAFVSYLADKTYFSNWMKVSDIIAQFADFFADFDRVKCLEMLSRLGIQPEQKIKSMSKGTIEKLQLCLTMARHARLYLLDEPLGGVDPAARDVILDTILNNYREDSSILISTHLIADVERIFDTVVFLKEGELVLCEDVDNIRRKENSSIDQLFREVFKC